MSEKIKANMFYSGSNFWVRRWNFKSVPGHSNKSFLWCCSLAVQGATKSRVYVWDLKLDHLHESYRAALSCSTFHYPVKGDCSLQVCGWNPIKEQSFITSQLSHGDKFESRVTEIHWAKLKYYCRHFWTTQLRARSVFRCYPLCPL